MVRDMYSSISSSSSRGGYGGDGGDMNMNMNIDMGMMNMKPAWLERLMGETFFGDCGVHKNQRKNEKNIFCLHCCLSICPHCLPSHTSHPLLQVRRYVYHNVIRLDDLEKLIDCSNIQPYTINSAKVIFLNQRPQSRSCKGTTNACFTCDRILQDPFHFCSLSCKVDFMVYQGQSLSNILHRFDESDFAISQFEGLRVDGSEVIDEDNNLNHIGPSSSNYSINAHDQDHVITSTKKKNKSNRYLPGIVLSLGSRRKGAPQRAPLL
ncbi:hypothetical protein P8452_16855 [Trifolium repens]|nr:hypothetical protein P8452_16855 [Trifolium repens]